MCWPGASGIEAGVTIDLELLKDVTYNSSNEIASIQPGARWSDVYSALDERMFSTALPLQPIANCL